MKIVIVTQQMWPMSMYKVTTVMECDMDKRTNMNPYSIQMGEFCRIWQVRKIIVLQLTTMRYLLHVKPQNTGLILMKGVATSWKLVQQLLLVTANIACPVMGGSTIHGQLLELLKYVTSQEPLPSWVKVIPVEFDNWNVGQEAKSKCLYKHIHSKAVPIM